MINFKDFERPDGFINWYAYHKAQQEAGERCYRCEAIIWPVKYKHKVPCQACADLETSQNEVIHDDYIRCPKCRTIEDISQWDCDYSREKYEEGEHEVECSNCKYIYKIYTYVEYSYKSPPVTKE